LLLNVRCRKLEGGWSIWRRNVKISEPDTACRAIKEEEEEEEEMLLHIYGMLAAGDLPKTTCQNLSIVNV
jgi:hypothetical protein